MTAFGPEQMAEWMEHPILSCVRSCLDLQLAFHHLVVVVVLFLFLPPLRRLAALRPCRVQGMSDSSRGAGSQPTGRGVEISAHLSPSSSCCSQSCCDL
jgi:hypothetical protein